MESTGEVPGELLAVAPAAPSTASAAASDTAPARRPGIVRRMYNWVLHWAETPYGTPALFGISFMESSFFPIPPDVLQLALSFSKPRRAFFYALVNTVGSVLGAILGWMIGYAFWVALDDVFYRYVPGMSPENIARVGELYHDNAFLAIFGAAFTPIPFKVFTVSAGVFHDYVALSTLIVAAIFGRSARFFTLAACVSWLGPTLRRMVERHFELMTLVFFALLVGGFFAIKFML